MLTFCEQNSHVEPLLPVPVALMTPEVGKAYVCVVVVVVVQDHHSLLE